MSHSLYRIIKSWFGSGRDGQEFNIPLVQFDHSMQSEHLEPTLEVVTSQICTSNQFSEPAYQRICAEIKQDVILHRKQWEYIYILRALEQFGKLQLGSTGVGFGCGKEPLAAVMAGRGASVLCTDIPPVARGDSYWGSTNSGIFFTKAYAPGSSLPAM